MRCASRYPPHRTLSAEEGEADHPLLDIWTKQMAFTDTALRALNPRGKIHIVNDDRGLNFVRVAEFRHEFSVSSHIPAVDQCPCWRLKKSMYIHIC
ncbi:hypothetical protein BC2230_10412 [Burkholderia cepacia]